MFFTGLGTATPPNRFTPGECWEALIASPNFQELNPRSQAILKKVLGPGSGIAFRYLSFDRLDEAFALTPDVLHARFTRHAPRLAVAAARGALAKAQLGPGDVDGIIVSTCTGYLCPGLTSYVIPDLGLRPDILAVDLVGQGCGAALPNLRLAEALLSAGRCRNVLSVCVEVCSAAFYLDNDPGVLISACLFADGAGAAVLSGSPPTASAQPAVEWVDTATFLSPENRDYLRFEQKGGFLRNILSKQVPGLAAKFAEGVLAQVLNRHGLVRGDIGEWIMHAGGREVLVSLGEGLGLSEHHLRWSSETLRNYGNVSSPFVFFVMDAALQGDAARGWWWLSSFGAGFTCHGALLKVH